VIGGGAAGINALKQAVKLGARVGLVDPGPLGGACDGREVWIYGERVADVTTHPAFPNPARMLARLYDALHDPATQPVLTCPTERLPFVTGKAHYTTRLEAVVARL